MNRILVAEDEQRIASFVEKGLRVHGFVSTVVADGAAALDHALSGDFDLLLLDIGLPSMDGFTVLRRIREADRSIPVIILTARHSASDAATALAGGANDFVTKPFRFDDLVDRVRLQLPADPAPEGGAT